MVRIAERINLLLISISIGLVTIAIFAGSFPLILLFVISTAAFIARLRYFADDVRLGRNRTVMTTTLCLLGMTVAVHIAACVGRSDLFINSFSVLFLIGTLFVALGVAIFDPTLPSRKPRCQQCGYDLRGSDSPYGPECGTARTDA